MKGIDPTTGSVVDVPDEGFQDAYQAGKVNLIPGSKLPMWSPQGELYEVPAEDVSANTAMGGKIGTQGELQKERDKAKYGGVVPTALGGAAALAEGASLGTTNLAAVHVAKAIGGKALADNVRGTINTFNENHPYARGALNIAGAALPSMVAGPEVEGGEIANVARTAARTVGAPARFLGAVGEAAGSLAPQAAEGAGLGTRLLAGVAKHAATGAAETVLFNAGNNISEAALGDDPQLTAEKVFAGSGHAAIMGAMFGAGMGAATELGSTALRSAAAWASPRAERLAGDQAVRALSVGSDRPRMRALEALDGGATAAGKQFIRDGVIEMGDNVETLAPKFETALEDAGKQVDKIRKAADAAGVTGPDIDTIASRMRRELDEHIASLPLPPATARGMVRQLVDHMRDSLGGTIEAIGDDGMPVKMVNPGVKTTFEDLAKWRTALDKDIRYNKPTLPGVPEDHSNVLRRMARGVVEDELEKALDVGTKGLPGIDKNAYKAAKLKFQQYKAGNDLVQEGLLRKTTNRVVSPSDMGAGFTGALMGGVAHGPMGAIAGGAAAVGHKMLRERGNATAAVLADKLATLGALSRAAAKADGEIDAGVNAFYKKSQGQGVRVRLRTFGKSEEKPGNLNSDYEKAVAHVQAMSRADIAKGQANIEQPMRHAPNTMTALASTAQTATSYLAANVPQGHQDPESLTPQLDKPRVTDTEKTAYLKLYKAVQGGPKQLFDELVKGHRPYTEVAALRMTQPALFKEIQGKIMQSFADPKVKPDFNTRIQLGILFDIPSDPSLKAATVQAMQATFQQPPPAKPGEAPTPKPTAHAVNTTSTAAASSLPLQSAPQGPQ